MPQADGVAMGGKYNGNCFGGLSGGLDHGRRGCKNDVDMHADKLGGEFRQLIHAIGPSELNHNVLALDVAEVAQALPQCLHAARPCRGRSETQESHPRDTGRLLRAHNDRPPGHDRRAAEKGDELAPSHGPSFSHGLGHELSRHLAGSAVEVPPKPAAPTPGLRSESLPHSAAGMNPCPTVIKS